MVFIPCGFDPGGEKSVCATYKQGSATLIPYLPSVSKKLFLSKQYNHCIAASSSRICPPEVGCLIDIWKLSILSMVTA